MKIIWILWAGSVMCGACSISRQRQVDARREVSVYSFLSHLSTYRQVSRELLTVAPGTPGEAPGVIVYRKRYTQSHTVSQRQGSQSDTDVHEQTEASYAGQGLYRERREAETKPISRWWVAPIALIL